MYVEFVCMWMNINVCVYGGQSTTTNVVPQEGPPLLRQGLHWPGAHHNWLKWMAIELPGILQSVFVHCWDCKHITTPDILIWVLGIKFMLFFKQVHLHTDSKAR